MANFMEENKSMYQSFYDYLIETECGINGLCKWIDNKIADEIYSAFTNYMGSDIKNMTQRKFSINFNKLLPSNIRTKSERVGQAVVKRYYID